MFSRSNHPDHGQLLRFCDGELGTSEFARIELHVRGCWECRTHIEEVRNTISDYVRYRREILQPAMAPPPAPWTNIEPEMLRLRNQEAVTSRVIPALRFRLPWIFAAAAALAAGAAAVYLTRPVPLAAPRVPAPVVQTPAPALPNTPRTTAALPAVTPALEVQPPSADDELNVIAALHGIGADLGDPVSVTRERDRIVVNTAGLDAARAARIRVSLAGLPRVSFDAPASDSPHVSSAVAEAAAAPSSQSPLARQFANADAYQKFVDRALESGDAVMTRAYALRSLASRFPATIEAQLSQEGASRLAAIRREHAAALVESIRTLERSLLPVLPPLSLSAAPAPVSDWQSATGDLFAVAQKTDRLIALLLGAAKADSAAVPVPADVANTLAQLKATAAAYQHQ